MEYSGMIMRYHDSGMIMRYHDYEVIMGYGDAEFYSSCALIVSLIAAS